MVWYCREEENVGNEGEMLKWTEKWLKALGLYIYIYIHTHTLLLNKKINKLDIEKATRLSILC